MSKKPHFRPTRQALDALVEAAAKKMHEEREVDPLRALEDASRRMSGLPFVARDVDRVRAALRRRLMLFEPGFEQRQRAMQFAALDAMQQLSIFQPRAMKGIVEQCLPIDAAIELELFVAHSDELRLFLSDMKIPFEQRFVGESTYFEFRAGEHLFCLHVTTQSHQRSIGSVGLHAFQRTLSLAENNKSN